MARKKQTMWRTNTDGEPIRRHMLKDILPMEEPLSIDIEVSPICCLECNYCPQSLSPVKKAELNIGQGSLMEFSLFKEFVNQCKGFRHPLKNLRFAGYGEPLLNPLLPEMIALCKKEGITDTVTVFSNGIPLTHDLSTELVKAGVDSLLLDIQGTTSNDYMLVANRTINFERLYENIQYYYGLSGRGKLFIKTFKFIIENREDEFFELFQDFSDEIVVENVYETCPEIEYGAMITDTKETCGVDFERSDYCPWPWYQMAVNARGKVTACPIPPSKHSDFLVIGDINQESIVDIWNGSRLNNVRYRLLTERQCIKECKDCKYTDMLPKEDLIDTEVIKLMEYCERKKESV